MSLTPGTRIGPYEIAAQIGAGGMGEVYRALDTNLGRQVAIKILPDAFAQDPERLARFDREAKTLATLNHPNVAQIYGFERADSGDALVMELVEGPTLADLLAGGPVPVDEALPIAKQITEALEAAHDVGVIHRDLKPANVKVRPDGTVKVLDFGLAKLLDVDTQSSSLSMSPTLSVHATYAGVILGTAAYMSPEQARGKPVDRRTDVWAFGCVLYEMVSGRCAFDPGETVSDAIAAVLSREPDWSELPPTTSERISGLLRRCLTKDPRRRFQSIGEARIAIEDAIAQPVSDFVGTSPKAASGAASRPAWMRALPWALASIGFAAAAGTVLMWAPWRTAPSPPPLRLSTELGADVSLVNQGASIALSPDGTVLAFVAPRTVGGSSQLYVRRLGQLQASRVAGTTNARDPFFSPNGQWIAFFADGKLKKVAVSGGAIVTLCDAPNDRGGTWADDDSIIFQKDSARSGLSRVSSAGGTPQSLTTLGDGEVTQRWPQALPGGRAVLYTGHSSQAGFDDANLVVQPLPAGPRKVVQRGGYFGRYLPSGHLVYMHDATLFAVPFDLSRLEAVGQPVPVLEGIASAAGGTGVNGAAQISISDVGTLAYQAGQSSARDDQPIQWLDRTGKATMLRATPSEWSNPQFSPDGRLLALDIAEGNQLDIWTYDWARDALSRLTFGAADMKPVWTPDGRRIAFSSMRGGGVPNLYWQNADGTGEAHRLSESKNTQRPTSWHPSGKFLAYYEQTPQMGSDIMLLPIEGDERSGWRPGKSTVFLGTSSDEREAVFSPDGRWIAYVSLETGRNQVYVRPFPVGSGKWQISSDGGSFPTWSRTSRQLFFASLVGQQIIVVPYSVTGDSFRTERPRPWSEARYANRPRQRPFDLHPDGARFAAAPVAQEQATTKDDKVVVILNFFDELRRVAPVK